jgi:hypothetical protein
LLFDPDRLEGVEKVKFEMIFEELVRDKVTGEPGGLSLMETSTGDEGVEMRGKVEGSTKGVGNIHNAREVCLAGIPGFEGEIDGRVEGVEVGFTADGEVDSELARGMEDKMLVLRIGKQGSVLFDPLVGLGHTTGGAEAGLTGVRNLFLLTTGGALIEVETQGTRTAFKEFVYIEVDGGTEMGMEFDIGRPMVLKDLFEFFTPD